VIFSGAAGLASGSQDLGQRIRIPESGISSHLDVLALEIHNVAPCNLGRNNPTSFYASIRQVSGEIPKIDHRTLCLWHPATRDGHGEGKSPTIPIGLPRICCRWQIKQTNCRRPRHRRADGQSPLCPRDGEGESALRGRIGSIDGTLRNQRKVEAVHPNRRSTPRQRPLPGRVLKKQASVILTSGLRSLSSLARRT
jgi:hypothetical protein